MGGRAVKLGPFTLVLADDGILDPIAIDIAARGIRPVALTRPERAAAAAAILADGGNLEQICRRLHVSGTAARRLAARVGRVEGMKA